MKFTPGPWEWRDGKHGYGLCGPDDEHVLDATYSDSVVEASDADACLIAAAPDLYDLLRRLSEWDMLYVGDGVSMVADGPYWKREIQAALAKARGGMTG
jgi:hypothetical protein